MSYQKDMYSHMHGRSWCMGLSLLMLFTDVGKMRPEHFHKINLMKCNKDDKAPGIC